MPVEFDGGFIFVAFHRFVCLLVCWISQKVMNGFAQTFVKRLVKKQLINFFAVADYKKAYDFQTDSCNITKCCGQLGQDLYTQTYHRISPVLIVVIPKHITIKEITLSQPYFPIKRHAVTQNGVNPMQLYNSSYTQGPSLYQL